MANVSNWVAHAPREPSAIFLKEIDAWWRRAAGETVEDITLAPPASACLWRIGPLHTLAMIHVDRAAHKRRRRALYISREFCEETDGHGNTPMSSIITGDPYGPEELLVEHSAPESSLVYALRRAQKDPNLLAVTPMTELEFSDPEYYHEHSSKQMKPLNGGVVVPFLCVPTMGIESDSSNAAMDREDLLRAHGYATYLIDIDFTNVTLDTHHDFAVLMDDILDEIAGIKADAQARVLSNDPLWPIVVMRTTPTWEYEREYARSDEYHQRPASL